MGMICEAQMVIGGCRKGTEWCIDDRKVPSRKCLLCGVLACRPPLGGIGCATVCDGMQVRTVKSPLRAFVPTTPDLLVPHIIPTTHVP